MTLAALPRIFCSYWFRRLWRRVSRWRDARARWRSSSATGSSMWGRPAEAKSSRIRAGCLETKAKHDAATRNISGPGGGAGVAICGADGAAADGTVTIAEGADGAGGITCGVVSITAVSDDAVAATGG